MRSLNKIIIVAIAAIALFVFTGPASAMGVQYADGLTVKVNTIQTNGVYQGIPVINSTGSPQVSYEYRLMPDGTYTVFGTVTNDNKTLTYDVLITAEGWHGKIKPSAYAPHEASTLVTVKNGTSASFSLTVSADSNKYIDVYVEEVRSGETRYDEVDVDMGHIDYTQVGDSSHTWDQGPMSDAVVIFTNGVPNYNGKPAYWIGLGL